MSSESVERKVEVDLSKLIEIDVHFKPLQLTLQDVLQRLAALEGQNAAKDAEIGKLQSEVDELRHKRGKHPSSASALHSEEGVEGLEADDDDDALLDQGGMDEMWGEIRRIKKLLGELKEAEERHTIDELYAARKVRESVISSPPASRQSSAQAMLTSAGGEQIRPTRRTSTKTKAQTSDLQHKYGTGRGEEKLTGGKEAEKNEEDAVMNEDEYYNTQQALREMPIGDIILSKAREDLPLDDLGSHTLPFMQAGHDGEGEGEEEEPLPLSEQQEQHRRHLQQLYNERVDSAFRHGECEDGRERERESSRGSTREDVAHGSPHGRVDRSGSTMSSRINTGRLPSRAESRSVFDTLLRDGHDIAYLNRVVAEMLGEMKSLHADVDFLRTHNEPSSTLMQTLAEMKSSESAGNDDDDTDANKRALQVTPELFNGLMQTLHKLENEIYDVNKSSNKRDDQLNSDVAGLRQALKNINATVASMEKELARLQSSHNVDGPNAGKLSKKELEDKLNDILNRLAEAERQTQMCQSKLKGLDSLMSGGNNGGDEKSDTGKEVSRVEFALLKGTVGGLEEQLTSIQPMLQSSFNNANKAVEQVEKLQREVNAIKEGLNKLGREVDKLEHRVGAVEQDVLSSNRNAQHGDLSESNKHGLNKDELSASDDLRSRLNELAKQLVHVQRELAHLEDDKADHALVQRMQEELKNLKRLMELHAERAAALAAEGGKNREAAESERDALQNLQKELINQIESYNRDRETGQEELRGLRELIDALDHRKADGALVANKAERDYVENALERLMREVEQVLNATNAGLIDTLDKSLNILRDMLDGKANKKDIAALQQMMNEEAAMQNAADALTGFKGFRCLGCNRPVDSLRPRPLPAKLNAFVNRNPQNYPNDGVTRAIQQSSSIRPADNTNATAAANGGRNNNNPANIVNDGESYSKSVNNAIENNNNNAANDVIHENTSQYNDIKDKKTGIQQENSKNRMVPGINNHNISSEDQAKQTASQAHRQGQSTSSASNHSAVRGKTDKSHTGKINSSLPPIE